MTGFRKIVAVFTAAVLLTGCSAARDVSADNVLHRGTLRIAVQDDERLNELSQFIAAQMGVQAECIPTDKQTALRMVSDGSADAAVGYYSKSDNPGLEYNLTIPFYTENIYAVCRADEHYTALTELSGMLLGADAELFDSVERQIAMESVGGKLYCTTGAAAAEMLQSEELDAFFCLESGALEILENGTFRSCMMPDIRAEEYCVVVSRDKPQLYGAINGAVGEYLTEESK